LLDAFKQLRLQALIARSLGDSGVGIGVVDGPVDLDHHAFDTSKISTTNDHEYVACKKAESFACIHGTFVTGILTGIRNPSAPAICPGCNILLRPIFKEFNQGSFAMPASTPEELAQAILDCINAGAKIINLSVGLEKSRLSKYYELEEVYNYAMKHGVIIVAAAGNQGQIGYFPIIDNDWIIPVVASNSQGNPHPTSNFGPSIARRGLMAPGSDISSTAPGGGYMRLSGTSFAAPFVTGAIALLWSIFRKASATEIVQSVRKVVGNNRSKIFPPMCDAEYSSAMLEKIYGRFISNK